MEGLKQQVEFLLEELSVLLTDEQRQNAKQRLEWIAIEAEYNARVVQDAAEERRSVLQDAFAAAIAYQLVDLLADLDQARVDAAKDSLGYKLLSALGKLWESVRPGIQQLAGQLINQAVQRVLRGGL